MKFWISEALLRKIKFGKLVSQQFLNANGLTLGVLNAENDVTSSKSSEEYSCS